MAKRLQQLLPALALGVLLPLPAIAQVESPVEQGLDQLAKQIVAKSKAAGKTAIAVLPFPNADGSCSVLSNFIADELIQSLFNVPGSGLEIVERSQLETLISELKLGASGLLNPETTKRLGSQSGVGALTVGTITVIGDTVRINARLIATETGKAVSAAAVDIPKVAAVSELLKQPVTTGPTCSPRKAASERELLAQRKNEPAQSLPYASDDCSKPPGTTQCCCMVPYHIHDLGQVFPSGTEIRIQWQAGTPGGSCSGGNALFSVSTHMLSWDEIGRAPIANRQGFADEIHREQIASPVEFRYVKIEVPNCYNDYSSAEVNWSSK